MTLVVLLDDKKEYHKEFRDALSQVLPEIESKYFCTSRELEIEIAGLNPWQIPSIFFIDVNLSRRGEGYDVCRKIKDAYPSSRIVILTEAESDDGPVYAVRSGATGYSIKDDFLRQGALGDVIRYQLEAASRAKELIDHRTEMFVSSVVHFMSSNIEFLSKYAEDLSDFFDEIILSEGALSGFAERKEKFLQSIAAQKTTLTERREKLLNYAQSSKRLLSLDSVNIFDRVGILEKTILSRRKVTVVRGDQNAELVVRLDQSLFDIAVGEVLKNALDYTAEDGEILIEVKTTEKSGFRSVEISIEDNGPGVIVEERERVFEPRFRGAAASNLGKSGFGFGLSGAKQAAQSHSNSLGKGDIICVEPESLNGARFILIFPELMGRSED